MRAWNSSLAVQRGRRASHGTGKNNCSIQFASITCHCILSTDVSPVGPDRRRLAFDWLLDSLMFKNKMAIRFHVMRSKEFGISVSIAA